MEPQKGPLDDLKMAAQQTAQKVIGDKPQKVLTFFGYMLEAQKHVLELELALIEDAQRILKRFAAPPSAQG